MSDEPVERSGIVRANPFAQDMAQRARRAPACELDFGDDPIVFASMSRAVVHAVLNQGVIFDSAGRFPRSFFFDDRQAR